MRAEEVADWLERFTWNPNDDKSGAIRALLAERDALRAALTDYVYNTTHLSPEEDDGAHWCRIKKSTLENARKALKP